MSEPFWTRQQGADYLHAHIRTFDRWVADRNIPSYKFGRNRRFKPTDIIAEAEKCRIDAIGTPTAPQTKDQAA
jgi:excisionase family DNA binding protein